MSKDSTFVRAWYWYDWAVSAFTTTVLAVFIGPYLTTITKSASVNGYINLLGIDIYAGSFVSYVITLSVLIQVLILPIVGIISDQLGKKHFFFSISAMLGAFATILMFYINNDYYLFGGIVLFLSNLFLGISMVIYNSYLLDICQEEDRDRVSAKGYAYGYLGGGILLLLNLILVMFNENIGITKSLAIRISLASAGVWWGAFSLIPIIRLKSLKPNSTATLIKTKEVFSKIIVSFKDLKNYPRTMLFLLAYVFFNDGIQAVIVISAQFGQEALNLDISTLAMTILLVQFVAFFGAYIFAWLSKKFNSKLSLMLSLIIWVIVLVYANLWLKDATGFYILGGVIGLVLGGSQSLSRSLFSLLIPKGKDAEYFSIYELCERGTSWIGPLIFGLSLQMTESYRFAILSIAVLFIVGMVLMAFIDIRKAITDAGNDIPKNFELSK